MQQPGERSADARTLDADERQSLARLAEGGQRLATLGHGTRPAAPGEREERYVESLLAAGSESVDEAQVAQERDAGPAGRARVVERFLPRVVAVARRYAGWGTEFADLVQEGVLALLEALIRYEPARGTPFWAYAEPWVRGAMYRLVQDERRVLRLPPRALGELVALKDAAERLRRPGAPEPAVAEVAAEAGLDEGRARTLLAADLPAHSLDEPLPGEPDVLLRDQLPDPRAEEAYDEIVASSGAPELATLLGALSSREREVVERRFGLRGPEETLQQVGDRLGVTRERVRQIEARALAKLRQRA